MAVHHYRALLMELCSISNPEGDLARQAELLYFAIGNAPAFRCFRLEPYEDISAWCKRVEESSCAGWDVPKYELREQFLAILMVHLPQMGQEWLDLGRPASMEDWERAKWPNLAELEEEDGTHITEEEGRSDIGSRD